MGFIATAEKLLLNTSVFLRRNLVSYGELKNLRAKKRLWQSVVLSKEQEQQIRDFLKENYGRALPTAWHRLYQSYYGVYRCDYFPEILFSSRLEPILNPYRTAELFGDKNLLHNFWDDIDHLRIPKTFFSSIRGVLRDGDDHIITQEQAVEILRSLKQKCVIKRSIETSSGRDVMILEPGCFDPAPILSKFGRDFIVQEWIQQSDALAALNESSLNTFRVMTYLCDGKVFLCPIALRLGRSGADRDNIHYGGICIGVNNDGALKKYAFSEFGEKFDRHPDSQVVFDGFRIPGAEKLLQETALRCHERMPYLGIISWDMSIDSQGNIVLIEVNTSGQSAWFCQMVNGEPLFGENTAKMLQMIRH